MVSNFANDIKTTTQSYKPYLKCYASIHKIELASLLFKENFIRGFFLEKHDNINYISILFKYDIEIDIFNSLLIINKNIRVKQLLKNANGLGFSFISTKTGFMPINKAQILNSGGCRLIKIN